MKLAERDGWRNLIVVAEPECHGLHGLIGDLISDSMHRDQDLCAFAGQRAHTISLLEWARIIPERLRSRNRYHRGFGRGYTAPMRHLAIVLWTICLFAAVVPAGGTTPDWS